MGDRPLMDLLWTVWFHGQTDTRYRTLQKPGVIDVQQTELF